MTSHESIGYKYGRALGERVNYLAKDIEENKAWEKYPRLVSFMNIWSASTGGSIDINEHTDFFSQVNDYSLNQINAVFKERYGLPIWHSCE